MIAKTQINSAKDIDVIISKYDLMEYRNNYSKTSEISWQYYRDEPSLNDDGNTIKFTYANHKRKLFKIKKKHYWSNRKWWYKRC